MSEDEESQNMLDKMSFNETKKMLVDLAIHFSEKTKLEHVPKGTAYWAAEKVNNHGSYPGNLTSSKIIIPLIPFFGMFVGYNSELDILVMWKF